MRVHHVNVFFLVNFVEFFCSPFSNYAKIPGVPKNKRILFPYISAGEHHRNDLLAYGGIPFNAILFHSNVNGLLCCNITQYG